MRGAALAIVFATSAATADNAKLLKPSLGFTEHDTFVFSERWRELPMSGGLKMEDRVAEHLSELGNLIGTHMNVLSHDAFVMTFDGRRSRARMRLGTGDSQQLRFNIDTDWHFMQDKARVQPRLELGIGNHAFKLDLPNIDMATNDVNGQLAVEVRLPLFERRF